MARTWFTLRAAMPKTQRRISSGSSGTDWEARASARVDWMMSSTSLEGTRARIIFSSPLRKEGLPISWRGLNMEEGIAVLTP